jgi:predicted ATPase
MPQGVREVIGQRLNRLSESCHQTLTIASVIGREFDFRLLHTLSDETTDEQLLGRLMRLWQPVWLRSYLGEGSGTVLATR